MLQVKELRPRTIFARVSEDNKKYLQGLAKEFNMEEGPLLNEVLTQLRVNNLLQVPSASKSKRISKKR